MSGRARSILSNALNLRCSFLRETFEPILRMCQSRLDDHEKLDRASPIPTATPHLCVSDRWALFVRRRSENFLLNDIANLKKAVESAGDCSTGWCDQEIVTEASHLLM